ncbi:ceramide-1-phosphate transfer protein-like [Artemia franciscana]|uniref:ceramide-1-phosphate transfer protein-like n=1 Tax=Artemia franciscana TaxID=6661 RepID=UPI0032DAB5DA
MQDFQLEKVNDYLLACHSRDEKLCLRFYISAYEELNKLFGLLGSLFGFISSDVQSKLEILSTYLADSENATAFSTVSGMLRCEKESGKLVDSKYISGSRTLLRLHRALGFLVDFLERISTLSLSDSLSKVCYLSYRSTLGNYHPQLIRLMVKGAVYTLSSKKDLLDKINKDNKEEEYYNKLLVEVVKNGRKVYQLTDALYTFHNLHDLP